MGVLTKTHLILYDAFRRNLDQRLKNCRPAINGEAQAAIEIITIKHQNSTGVISVGMCLSFPYFMSNGRPFASRLSRPASKIAVVRYVVPIVAKEESNVCRVGRGGEDSRKCTLDLRRAVQHSAAISCRKKRSCHAIIYYAYKVTQEHKVSGEQQCGRSGWVASNETMVGVTVQSPRCDQSRCVERYARAKPYRRFVTRYGGSGLA